MSPAARTAGMEALTTLRNHLRHVEESLNGAFPANVAPPAEVAQWKMEAVALRDTLGSGERSNLICDLDERPLALLRTAVAIHRRGLAERVEATQSRLTDSGVIEQLGAQLAPFDALLNASFLQHVKPAPLPRIASFTTAHGREPFAPSPELAPPELDPKHRALLSASLINHDLTAYRRHCEDRRLALAILFADLDNFKQLNERHTEVVVDRFVLPPILAAVEAASYGHGRSYRHGGDEFLLLLPNAPKGLTIGLASQLAQLVEEAPISMAAEPVQLSIGVWITHPESHLTNTELIQRASAAKQEAKRLGKARLVLRVELGSHYEETVKQTV